jgi:putative Mg2+ transporter-C (MgtC) family protein
MIFPAVASTLISLVVLYGLRRLKPLMSRDIFTLLTLRFSDNSTALDDVIKIFTDFPEISIQFINTFQNVEAQVTTYRLRLESKELIHRNTITEKLFQIKGLEELSWEEGNVP